LVGVQRANLGEVVVREGKREPSPSELPVSSRSRMIGEQ